ncbi:MAG: hypothetical protein KAG28_07100 [Cocleimonas sp.]|nr:hypothetical protein [Cocleimonas sp.]
MRVFKGLPLFISLISAISIGVLLYLISQPKPVPTPTKSELKTIQKNHSAEILGINTNEVREDTSSIPFVDLFKASIPFAQTFPWLSKESVEYDKNGWPKKLNGGVAGTKFLNRLPAGTVPDGFYTVLYEGQGKIHYGNDAAIVVRRPGKDIIEIKAGKDKILNASLVIQKTDPQNYIRNIHILMSGGICSSVPYRHVQTNKECAKKDYLSFEQHYKTILFNPYYLDFMRHFKVVRFMNMSGMTRKPIENWSARNTLEKASWGGKPRTRGAPLEIMVALANRLEANPWFSMPYRASDDYIKQFAAYVNKHLNPNLKVYVEYSNETWNPIFVHYEYAMKMGLKQNLDQDENIARQKYYSKRSVETFKIWEREFKGNQRLIRTLGGWSSNPRLSSLLLSYNDAYKFTDALAVAPYFTTDLEDLRKAKTTDDVFDLLNNTYSKRGVEASIQQMRVQQKVAEAFGVDLVAYEGGQHLVDWDTRTVDQDPNPLLYATNRDPRMGELYLNYLREWDKAGGKVFVLFSAPRIYSWYGSWGLKEYVTQARDKAPKFDAALTYLKEIQQTRDHSKRQRTTIKNQSIPILATNTLEDIWSLETYWLINPSAQKSVAEDLIESDTALKEDLSAKWQAHWDQTNFYLTLAVQDDKVQKGDNIRFNITTDKLYQFEYSPHKPAEGYSLCLQTEKGYLLTASIPWKQLNVNPKVHTKLRLRLHINDVDKGAKTQLLIWPTGTNQQDPVMELSAEG